MWRIFSIFGLPGTSATEYVRIILRSWDKYITKGKKLNALKQVFYVTPQPLPDVIKDPGVLQTLTLQELKKMAKKRELSGYNKLKKSDLVEVLSQ